MAPSKRGTRIKFQKRTVEGLVGADSLAAVVGEGRSLLARGGRALGGFACEEVSI